MLTTEEAQTFLDQRLAAFPAYVRAAVQRVKVLFRPRRKHGSEYDPVTPEWLDRLGETLPLLSSLSLNRCVLPLTASHTAALPVRLREVNLSNTHGRAVSDALGPLSRLVGLECLAATATHRPSVSLPLSAWPGLRRLVLDTCTGDSYANLLDAVLASPCAATLESLDLRTWGSEGLAKWWPQVGALPALTEFGFSAEDGSADGCEAAVAAAISPARLDVLMMSSVSPDLASAMLVECGGATPPTRMRTLWCDLPFGSDGAALVSDLPVTLETLRLGGFELDRDDVFALLDRCPRLAALCCAPSLQSGLPALVEAGPARPLIISCRNDVGQSLNDLDKAGHDWKSILQMRIGWRTAGGFEIIPRSWL